MVWCRWILAWGCALTLGACGGGGGDSSVGGTTPPVTPPVPPSSAEPDYAPLAVGDTWVYRRSDGGLDQTQVTGIRSIGGQPAFTYSDTEVGTSNREAGAYRKSATAITEVPTGDSPFLTALGAYDTLRLPLRVGTSYVQVDRTVATGFDVDGDGRDDPIAIRSTVTVLATETITVPAGTFDNCMKVRTVATQSIDLSSTGRRQSETITVDEWYAPEIGLVRSRPETAAGAAAALETRELLSFRVGTRSNDTSSPQITATSPARGATVGRSVTVTLDFDEAIDGHALASNALQLLDASGAVVATGEITVTNTRLEARLASDLPSGTYNVRLDNSVQDLLGNRLAAQQWALNIDGSGPTLVSSTPADKSTQVPLDATIVLQFSEPVNLDSVLQSVAVTTATGGGFVRYNPSSTDARTVRLQLTEALSADTNYQIRINGYLADLLGNRLGGTSPGLDAAVITLDFSTGKGLFLQPQSINTFINNGNAIAGDVSGDGRADVLYVGPAVDTLQVRRQLPDGTLAAASGVAWRANTVCVPDSMQVADINGDGRRDLVVAERGCGIEVMLQDVSGALQSGPFLPSANSHQVRVVDMNGDGRLDIVAIGLGSNTNTVSVWLQQADGSWAAPTNTPLVYQGTVGLAVGDLNGDGRPDVAVSSFGSGLGQGVGLLYQRADGSFAAAALLQVDPFWGASGLAIGDLNGDGRLDLVSGFNEGPDGLAVFYQAADGSLSNPQRLPGFDRVLYLAVADLNGDGRSDLLVHQFGLTTLVLMVQQPNGTLQRVQQLSSIEFSISGRADGPSVADLNGDGLVDVLLLGPQVMYAAPRPASRSSTRLPRLRTVSAARGSP